MREFAETDEGKGFFKFLWQTVRFRSISSIGDDLTLGQFAFLEHSIITENKRITTETNARNERQELMNEAARIEQFTEEYFKNINQGSNL